MTRRGRRSDGGARRMAAAPPPRRAAAGDVSATLMGLAGQARIVPPDFEKLKAGLAAPPAAADIVNVLGNSRRRDEMEAIAADCRAKLMTQPDSLWLHFKLGETLRALGDRDGAIAAFRRCHAIDPSLGSDFYLSAMGLGEVPDKMPEKLVATLFNSYAETFEQHLVRTLKYQAPGKLAAVVKDVLGDGRPPLDVCDIGCGTGLAGEHLRPLARRLDGVDLSAGMIAKAREKRLYDRLIVGELCAALNEARLSYDLVVAADVLIYFGDLQPPFAAAHAALRPGGHFAFTVEKGDGDAPVLGEVTRYRHSGAYIERTAAATGFRVVRRDDFTLRFEKGIPVDSLLYVLAPV